MKRRIVMRHLPILTLIVSVFAWSSTVCDALTVEFLDDPRTVFVFEDFRILPLRDTSVVGGMLVQQAIHTVTLRNVPHVPLQNGIVFLFERAQPGVISDSFQVSVIPGAPDPNNRTDIDVRMIFRSDDRAVGFVRGCNQIEETGGRQTIASISRLADDGRSCMGGNITLPQGLLLQVESRDDVPMPGNPQNQAKSDGGQISFDVATDTLSIMDHSLVDTGFPSDPARMANVSVPDFDSLGRATDGSYLFQSTPNDVFQISDASGVFLQARLPLLTYLVGSNSFFGELSEFQFNTSLGSPWIAEMAALFDPSSSRFDPSLNLYFTYQPRDNLFSLTGGFLQSNSSSGMDAVFAAQAIPEPSSLTLFSLGILSLAGLVWRQRKRG